MNIGQLPKKFLETPIPFGLGVFYIQEKYEQEKKKVEEVRRGEIYIVNLEPVIGSEQGGERPVVILQNGLGNKYSPTVVVASLASKTKKKRWLPTHTKLHCESLPADSMALLEQIRTIDKHRLGDYIGKLNSRDMKRVERALLASVGIRGRERTYGCCAPNRSGV